MWSVFAVVVVGSLALDLFVFHRQAHEVRAREAGMWVLIWVALAAAFAAWIWLEAGSRAGLEFTTGYLVEYALSVDNIFVFIIIFRYFGTPPALRHRVLFWGILGAVVLRGLFVLAGSALISRVHWRIYIFGAFLLWTGIGLLRKSEMEMDPENNPVLRFLRKHLRRATPSTSSPASTAGSSRRRCWLCCSSSRARTWCSRWTRSPPSSASPAIPSSSLPLTYSRC